MRSVVKMNFQILFIFVAAISSESLGQGTPEGVNDILSVNLPVYRECGGVIPLSHQINGPSQRIEYKYDTNFNNDEFCVWTLLGDDSITQIELSFETEAGHGDGIVVYECDELNLSSHRINNVNETFTSNSTSLIVTFNSNYDWVASGLRINISTEGFFGPTSRRAYFIISDEEGRSVSYPKLRGEDSYDYNETTTIVLQSAQTSPRQFYEYRLRNTDLELYRDFVTVYILLPFDHNYAPHYQKIGTFSGNNSGTVTGSVIITPYPVLYIFSSDAETSGHGFTIEWERYKNRINGSNF